MKYFTKYLPEKGNLQEGDKVYYKSDLHTIIHKEESSDWVFIDPDPGYSIDPKELTKVKLFLCSRDIQVGDKVLYANSYYKVLDINDVGYLVKMSDGEFRLAKGSCEKVIGEISPEATWVKEGMEFDEDEVRGFLKDEEMQKLNDNTLTVGIKYVDKNWWIQVKCPTCGHFH